MAKKELIKPRYRLKVKQRLAIVLWAVEHGIKPAGARVIFQDHATRVFRNIPPPRRFSSRLLTVSAPA